jgi:HAD superfamily hydrolase (TIGR01509 family)
MSIHTDRLKAVIFDVDGTLYHQTPLRRAMLLRLVRTHLVHPVQGWRTLRTLSAYRRAQEALRGELSGDVAGDQITMACERTGSDRAAVLGCVERWMEQEPLSLLPGCRHAGLVEFLHACRARGLRLAALSDYPASAKLRALGIADLFEIDLCAQVPEVGVFKPHPRGLLVVTERLGLTPDQCLYVGDRADVDAAAAAAAGMPCAIVTRNRAMLSDTHTAVASYPHLGELLFRVSPARSAA